MVTLVKQFGTNWEEGVGELRDFSDHVYCSQNSLQRSGGSERAGVCRDGPPASAVWQQDSFWRDKYLESRHLTFLRT